MEQPVTAVIPTMTNKTGLEHLLAELKSAKIKAVVMDNSSRIKNHELRIKDKSNILINSGENLGFSKAVNEGVKQAKTEWVLILNDDVEGITEDLVNRLISISVNRQWVAVTPVLRKPAASSHPELDSGSFYQPGDIENIGYTVLPIGKVALNFNPKNDSSEVLDGITAACMLIKRDVFEWLGGFDETFFAYLEDVDLCLRLKEKGYRFGVATDLFVTHQHQATAKRMPKRVAWLNLVNWWRMVFKHPKKFILSPTLPGMLIERGRNLAGWIKV